MGCANTKPGSPIRGNSERNGRGRVSERLSCNGLLTLKLSRHGIFVLLTAVMLTEVYGPRYLGITNLTFNIMVLCAAWNNFGGTKHAMPVAVPVLCIACWSCEALVACCALIWYSAEPGNHVEYDVTFCTADLF